MDESAPRSPSPIPPEAIYAAYLTCVNSDQVIVQRFSPGDRSMSNTSKATAPDFEQRYQSHLQHLKLKGLRPKTIDA